MDLELIAWILAIIGWVVVVALYAWHRNAPVYESIEWVDDFFDHIRGMDDTVDGHIEWMKEQIEEFLQDRLGNEDE